MTQPNLNIVPFVSVDHMMKLVLRVGVETFLKELAGYVEEDFRRWQNFDKTPRVASHSKEGVIELMPTSDGTLYGFKYVNGHPKNTRDGLQTVTAFGVLADVGSGYPMLLTEMTILTALRTAATSAVAAKHLAPKNARTMAIIGNGAQSEFQALAFKAILGVDKLRLYDLDPQATANASETCKAGFNIAACKSVEEAVEGADIITTVTADKANATILTDNMVGAGVHINAVGGDCPARQNCTAISFAVRIFSWNIRRRPASKVKSSNCRKIIRSMSYGKSLPAGSLAARMPARSRCSTRSALRQKISRRCAMCVTS